MKLNPNRLVLTASVVFFVAGPALAEQKSKADSRYRKMKYTSRSPADARAWQQTLRAVLAKRLRIDDLIESRIPFAEKVISSKDRVGYIERELEINSTIGRRIRVLLTVPTPRGEPRAAVVCIHGHGGTRRSVHDSDSIYKGFATELARRGVVTIACDVGRHDVYESGRTLMGERLWDCMRCVDYLESMPEVDAERIGCAGLSLGGEMAMWLASMDTRIAATVSCGFLTVMDQMERNHCMCWKFPGLRELVDFADIYALIAPRALQCQNGRQESPTQFTVELAEKAMREIEIIYRDLDAPDKAHLHVHAGGHEVELPALVAFLGRHLAFSRSRESLRVDRAWLVERFDALLGRQVEAATKEPLTNESGGIAWGWSYQLAALAEMLDATRDPKYAEWFVKVADQVVAARDDRHNRRDEYRGRVVPAWGSSRYSGGKHYAWAVHTGMITAPMARFAAVVRQDENLSARFGDDAARLADRAAESLAVHDDQYREGPAEGEGYLYGLHLDKHLPLNQQNAPARGWLFLADAGQAGPYRERAKALARFYKNRLRTTETGACDWSYWPGLDGPGRGSEDVSHAAINADFMVICYEHGIVFEDTDLDRLEKTLLNSVIVADHAISDHVGGSTSRNNHASQVYRWSRLARHREPVRLRLIQLLRAGHVGPGSTGAIGIAHLVAASNPEGRRGKAAPPSRAP